MKTLKHVVKKTTVDLMKRHSAAALKALAGSPSKGGAVLAKLAARELHRRVIKGKSY